MESTEKYNHVFATIGWGMLLIWWGVVIAVKPITISMGAIGTGLIFLGVNAVRWMKGVPIRDSTTTVGLILIIWGGVVQGMGLHAAAAFGTLLIAIGVAMTASLLKRPKTV